MLGLAKAVETICRNLTISYDGDRLPNALLAIVIISMKNIDNKRLYESVLQRSPDNTLDWDLLELEMVDGFIQHNKLGDTNRWLLCVDCLEFPDVDTPEMQHLAQMPIMTSIKDAIVKVGIFHTSIPVANTTKMGMHDMCKLLILTNVAGITSSRAIAFYVIERFGTTLADSTVRTTTLTDSLVSAFADHRFDKEVYFETLVSMLSLCTVNTSSLHPSMVMNATETENKHEIMRQNKRATRMGASMRPSLREIIKSNHNSDDISNSMYKNANFDQTNAFQTFCTHVRFPASLSLTIRLRCYLMYAMAHILDPATHLLSIIQKDIANRITQSPSPFLDQKTIAEAILTIDNLVHIHIIQDFKRIIFSSFAINHLKKITLLQYLHLFVAAYQHPDVWRNTWVEILPVMSTQIARDVELFVSTHTFPAEEFVNMIACKPT
jgi:hypothetical protein